MSINKESDIAADLQIGVTEHGMVRLYIKGGEIDLPLDFDASDAREIAEEILSAAQSAEQIAGA